MKNTSRKQTLIYAVVIVLTIGIFYLLGNSDWTNGMMRHANASFMSHWNWTQIIISLAIGFGIGLFVAKRKW